MHTMDEIMNILSEVKPGIEAGPDTELVRTRVLDSVGHHVCGDGPWRRSLIWRSARWT